MIQSHLLLVLALITMEPPSTLDADDLRGAMAQVLRATAPVAGRAARGRAPGALHRRHDRRPRPARLRRREGRRPRAARPRRSPRSPSPSTTGGGPGCPSCCARARPSTTPARTSSSPSSPCRTCPSGSPAPPRPPAAHRARPRRGAARPQRQRRGRPLRPRDRVTRDRPRRRPAAMPTARFSRASSTATRRSRCAADVAEECWRIITPILEAWKIGRGAAGRVPGRQRGAGQLAVSPTRRIAEPDSEHAPLVLASWIMLPEHWIEHRRDDREPVGWIVPEGEGFRPVAPPGPWITAGPGRAAGGRGASEALGIGFLADRYLLRLPDGTERPVRISEASATGSRWWPTSTAPPPRSEPTATAFGCRSPLRMSSGPRADRGTHPTLRSG